MRGGLAWLDAECRQAVRQGSSSGRDAQRTQILDDIAWPAKAAARDERTGVAFFNRFRDLTASGVLVQRDGRQGPAVQGNVFNPDWNGCPAGGLAKLGVSYDRHDDESARSGMPKRLGIGFIGSGFNAQLPPAGLRRACATPTCSASGAPTRRTPQRRPRWPRALDVGDASAYTSIDDMVADPAIDASGSAGRTTRGSRTSRRSSHAIERGRGQLDGHRLREAAGPQRGRGEAGAPSWCKRAGLSTATSRTSSSRRRSSAGASSSGRAARAHGPALPRPRGRGAQRAARALVLAGRAAGRRRAQRHDVPLGLVVRHLLTEPGRRRSSPSSRSGHRPHRVASSGPAPQYAKQLCEDDGQGRGLREAPGGRLRQRRRSSSRPPTGIPSSARRRRPGASSARACASPPSCSARSTRCRGTRSTPGSSSSSAARCRARRARTWSRSRTQRRD